MEFIWSAFHMKIHKLQRLGNCRDQRQNESLCTSAYKMGGKKMETLWSYNPMRLFCFHFLHRGFWWETAFSFTCYSLLQNSRWKKSIKTVSWETQCSVTVSVHNLHLFSLKSLGDFFHRKKNLFLTLYTASSYQNVISRAEELTGSIP